MTYYASPELLAANPPETWTVTKRADRMWGLHIDTSYEHPAERFRTKREALAERDDPNSYTRRMVEQERLWYAGVTPAGWKTYEQCKAERERNERYQAERAAQRAAAQPEYRPEQWPAMAD